MQLCSDRRARTLSWVEDANNQPVPQDAAPQYIQPAFIRQLLRQAVDGDAQSIDVLRNMPVNVQNLYGVRQILGAEPEFDVEDARYV